MTNRVQVRRSCWLTRLLSTSSLSTVSASTSGESTATASAASRENPPRKTPSLASIRRCSSSRSPALHSIVLRRVCCRSGRSRAPPTSTASRRSSRSSSEAGERTRMRAAASSRASGTPSSASQIRATASWLSGPDLEVGLHRPRPLDEERDRRARHDLGERRAPRPVRETERPHFVAAFPADPQQRPARHEQREPGRLGPAAGTSSVPRRRPARSCRGRAGCAARGAAVDQLVEDGRVAGVAHAEGQGDGVRDELRVAHRATGRRRWHLPGSGRRSRWRPRSRACSCRCRRVRSGSRGGRRRRASIRSSSATSSSRPISCVSCRGR